MMLVVVMRMLVVESPGCRPSLVVVVMMLPQMPLLLSRV